MYKILITGRTILASVLLVLIIISAIYTHFKDRKNDK